MSCQTNNNPVPTTDFACAVARTLADGRCENALVLDVTGLSQVTDYIVIASGTSDRQLRAMVGELKDLGKHLGHDLCRHDGQGSGEWIVIDFVDVMVHLLTAEHRVFYDLESLWGDSKRIDWASVTEPGQYAHVSAARRASA